MEKTKILIKELRAEFLTASVLPVLVATTISYYEKSAFNLRLFLLTLAGVIFLHLGTNVANDYFDHISGADELNTTFVAPFTGGSRLIQAGLVTPRGVLTLSIVLFALAAAVGVFLYTVRGPAIILFGITGLVLGILYTEPRAMLSGRGIGEAAILLAFGLIAVGAYYVQTGFISPQALVAPLPLAILTAAIILINEFQDAAADEATGKRTMIVRLGRKRGVVLYAAVTLSAYVTVIAGVLGGLTPRWTLIALAALPVAVGRRPGAVHGGGGGLELAAAGAVVPFGRLEGAPPAAPPGGCVACSGHAGPSVCQVMSWLVSCGSRRRRRGWFCGAVAACASGSCSRAGGGGRPCRASPCRGG